MLLCNSLTITPLCHVDRYDDTSGCGGQPWGSAIPAQVLGAARATSGVIAITRRIAVSLQTSSRRVDLGQELPRPPAGCLMALHFAFPPTGVGVIDEELFGLESGAEARSVFAGGEEFGTVECEVTFAWAFCWQPEIGMRGTALLTRVRRWLG